MKNKHATVELTTDILPFGTDTVSEEVNTSILNSPSVSLSKNKKLYWHFLIDFLGTGVGGEQIALLCVLGFWIQW